MGSQRLLHLLFLFFLSGRRCSGTSSPLISISPCLSVLWGTAAMSAGAAHSMAGLVVARVGDPSVLSYTLFMPLLTDSSASCLRSKLLLGAEAPYLLSLFYQRRELGLRVSLLLGMSPLANCSASARSLAAFLHVRGKPTHSSFSFESSVLQWAWLISSMPPLIMKQLSCGREQGVEFPKP